MYLQVMYLFPMRFLLLLNQGGLYFLINLWIVTPTPLSSRLIVLKSQTMRTPSLPSIPFAEEIKGAVFGLKQQSSPGPDGFIGVFFTFAWIIIGLTVSKAVQHFFQTKRIHKASNTFFLSLIPKSKSPATFADFKPISPLNFTYKII